ncbi:S-layer homology domain-containing protein [Paenibacillus chungangensis]|uniref:S-layer homology domain-containing protein n=1 Tax=Paenibacillus chungangensis TaxID=696535 RepID=A0ABW3HQM7_9BACL
MNWTRFTAALLCIALAIPAMMTAPKAAHAADEMYEEVSVPNNGFEEALGDYPGWTTVPELPQEGLHVSVANSVYGSSTNSLYMTDDNSKKSLQVLSGLVPITPGEKYKLSSSIYVQAKSVRVYLHFKKEGSNTDLTGGQINVLANTVGQWKEIALEGIAPADADYAQVSFYYGASGVGTKAYIDHVKLERVVAANPLQLHFDEPVMIGDAVSYALSQAAAYGIGPDGKWEQYVATVGSPVSFHVVDASTGELKFTQQIAGSGDTIWSIVKGSDDNMYFSSNGMLYRYVTAERAIEALGLNPSNKQVFDLKASSDGKIYGSTFSSTNMGRVFEYDILSGEFSDWGVAKDGQQYARGLGVTEDYVYVGIGTTAHLIRYDRETGDKSEVLIPGVSGTSRTLSEIDVYGGKLFVYGGKDLFVIDEQSGELINTLEFQSKLAPPSPDQPNLVYYKLAGELYAYDITNNSSALVDNIPELPADTAIKNHAWITPDSGPLQGVQVLAGMAAFGESFLLDPATKRYTEHAVQVPASATSINAMESDGTSLYMGGYQRGMSVYDLDSGEFLYRNKEFHQPEGISFLNDAVYFGTYSGAVMYRLDRDKPFQYNELGEGNPGLAADIEADQDRPFTMTSGDGKLFIGTFPTYGQLGGALTILEESEQADGSIAVNTETVRHIVPDQSLFGLAYLDGKIYGGTSVWGGLGSVPPEAEAKMFVYDTVTRTMVQEPFTPRIPGVNGDVKLIGELSVGPDGLIWGILDGFIDQSSGYDAALFAMHPETLEIVKSKVITNSPYNTSKFRPYYIRWGEDGLIYSTIGRKLMAIDPADLRSKQVIPGTVNLMTMGEDGSLYYAQGSKLHKVPVQLDSASLHADKSTIEVGEAATASISVMQKNGKLAQLGGAEIIYTSSAPDIVSVSGDQLIGQSVGTTSITAQVVLDGRLLTTSAIDIAVSPAKPKPIDPPTYPPVGPSPVMPTVDGSTIILPEDIAEQAIDSQLLDELFGKYDQVDIHTDSAALIPVSSLNKAGESTLIIRTEQGSWTLDISQLPLKDWEALLEGDQPIENSFIRIAITGKQPSNGETDEKAASGLLSPWVTFSLSVTDQEGQSILAEPIALPHGGKLTLRTGETLPEGAIVVAPHPATGEPRFIPSRLREGEAMFFSNGNDQYALYYSNSDISFADTSGHWAEEAILRMAGRLIVEGRTAHAFAPEQPVNRAEFMALMNRVLGLQHAGESESSFSDVASDSWFVDEVNAAVSAGLIGGYEDGSFRPERSITRAEAAVILNRALQLAGYDTALTSEEEEDALQAYADAADADYAMTSMALAVKEGLFNGRTPTALAPREAITRAEAVMLMERLLQLLDYM